MRKYLSTGFVLLSVCLGPACQKELNINQDPNYPTPQQGDAAVVFPVAVLSTTAYAGGDVEIVGGMWAQFFTQSAFANQYTDVDSYDMPNTDGFVNGPWDDFYTNSLKNYQYVIQKAQAAQDWAYYLLGTVMNAYTTELLVDLYDQIPYSQALQGASNLDPKFDSGYSVYETLLQNIDTALSKDLTASTNSSPSASQDPIFGGSLNSWVAFANTLKLKMYLRMVNSHPAEAQAAIQAMLAADAPFLTVDASFTTFTDNPGLENPFYEQNIRELNTNSNLRASTTLVSWFEANNDPRITYWFGSTNPPSENQGDYRDNNAAYSQAPTFFQSPTDPVEFISAAESYFLQAEAAVRYAGGAGAQALYNDGVTASFNAVGDTAAPFIAPGGAYAWGNEVEGGNTLTPLQQILRQKWASETYGCHAIEAFFDQERTGIPAQSSVYSTSPSYIPGQIVVAKNSVLPSGDVPERMVFPYDEASRNSNTPTQVPMQTPVWWGM